jgi:hypothetical protein
MPLLLALYISFFIFTGAVESALLLSRAFVQFTTINQNRSYHSEFHVLIFKLAYNYLEFEQKTVVGSVADPDPPGYVSQWSGSFNQEAKIIRKTFIPTVL